MLDPVHNAYQLSHTYPIYPCFFIPTPEAASLTRLIRPAVRRLGSQRQPQDLLVIVTGETVLCHDPLHYSSYSITREQ